MFYWFGQTFFSMSTLKSVLDHIYSDLGLTVLVIWAFNFILTLVISTCIFKKRIVKRSVFLFIASKFEDGKIIKISGLLF